MAAAILEEAAADIAVIQEVENEAMLAALNQKLKTPYPVAYVTRFADGTRINERMNAGVLARVKIESPTELDFAVLSVEPRPARGLLRFEVPLDRERRLLVYTGHLKSNYGEKDRNIAQRTAALRLLREDCDRVTAARPGAYEVIFLGDTNVDPELPSFARDTSFSPLDGWKDLWRGIPIDRRVTVPLRKDLDGAATPPDACFDRIFVSPELTQPPWTAGTPTAIAKGVDREDVGMPPGFGDQVSDHYPVYVDLTR
jgi:endonuclease/exonuclease/phosphatase family metal-dependent hydrolase